MDTGRVPGCTALRPVSAALFTDAKFCWRRMNGDEKELIALQKLL
ncbi:hypothetical protein RBY4I_2285 [Rhodobacterales bacterium Y4I]|nr:hypothetical protein RBY4I_2285 [Rhodobacterales bacterium Y4I]